ncbi:hypothetical protein PR001_g33734 [Phytophthora rubi]|uniref:Uncharacterized protein n=1 Tax=Phytophthora rubi TaxID=129364 RepID=A0A6A3FZ35_9STRA|nr:hypothetical protein PR001_g33734 [Phytophthora rubi]
MPCSLTVSVQKDLENLVGNDSFTYFNGLLPTGSISDANMTKANRNSSRHWLSPSGQAMPEILYGGVNPSDKLAITYPKDLANAAIP